MTKEGTAPASMLILVVEDEPLQNQLLTSFAQSLGHRASSATTGEEALAQFRQETPDLVFLDYELPDTTGEALVTQLRSMRAQWLPIIFLSAHNAVEIQRQCLAAGGDDFISKPLDYTILGAKLEAMMRVARLQRQIQSQNKALSQFVTRAKEENEAARYLYDRLIRSAQALPSFTEQQVIPAEGFSGDLLAFNEGPNGHYYWLLADATGHGLTAAISLIPITQVFYAMTQKGHNLAALVSEMHRQLKRYTPSHRFVCAVVLEIDPIHRSLSIWNGGMPDVWLLNAHGKITDRLGSKHMPLGLQAPGGFNNTVEHCTYEAGAQLFASSDGLVEAENAEGESYGDKRLEKCFNEHECVTLVALKHDLAKFLGMQKAQDDIALLKIALPEPQYLVQDVEMNKEPFEFQACAWQLQLSGAQLKSIDPVPLATAWLNSVKLRSQALNIAHVIIQELVNNAVDHGLLELSSQLKEGPDGFSRYLAARQERLNEIKDGQLNISLTLEHGSEEPQLRIEVTDSGKGFEWTNGQGDDLTAKHGRGRKLIRSLSKEVHIFNGGSKTVAIIGL